MAELNLRARSLGASGRSHQEPVNGMPDSIGKERTRSRGRSRMRLTRPTLALFSLIFLLGYGVGGMDVGVVMLALATLSWAAWPRERR